MKVKVECSCSARFEFEVEPVNGRMPVSIACPQCGADATELANAVIQQQSAAAPGLRIAKSHAEPRVPPTVPQPVSQEVSARLAATVRAQTRDLAADRPFKLFKWIFLAAMAVALVVAGFWTWYAWFARNPQVAYSLPIPVRAGNSSPVEFYELVGPGQLFSIKSKNAALYDIAKASTIWTVPLQTGSEAAPDGMYSPNVVATSNDLWLTFSDRVICLNRKTGERKQPAIEGTMLDYATNADVLMVVYAGSDAKQRLSCVSLPDESVATTEVSLSPGAFSPPGTPAQPRSFSETSSDKVIKASSAISRGLQSSRSETSDNSEPGDANASAMAAKETPFALSGHSVLQMKTRLIEKKTITHEAIKAGNKSTLDDANLTASQGLDVAQEMVNDSQRQATGGVEVEDVSRFQVTLHRWFGESAPDWTGEVTGPPRIYSLKTVDLLAAGQSLLAFDKQNKKLWEGKLTYSLHWLPGRPVMLETKDSLYFADPGVLTCYNPATGDARWRLDSVGISAICADEQGFLYLASSTASPDHITHPHQINLNEKIHPVLMKVDPANGRMIWRLESEGSDCFFSGKFLYAAWTTRTQSALKFDEGPDTHYNLRLLEPSNGREIWLYHQDNHPVLKTEIQQNWILLQFADGVTVLKFFSL